MLCTICARGGSKGVVNKNIRDLQGRPLIAWSIEQARQTGLFDLIAVSSDSEVILTAAREAGADLMITRPDELATDQAGKIAAIRHCVDAAEEYACRRFDVLVDLDATSPLRNTADIAAAVALLQDRNASNVITAMTARRSPYFNMVEVGQDGRVGLAKPLPGAVVRRQDAPQCFDMNASIYVWRHDALFEDPPIFKTDTALYIMPEERSIDIDSEFDFRVVEMVMAERMR